MKPTLKYGVLLGFSMLLCQPLMAWAQQPGSTEQTNSLQPITVVTVLLICAFAIDRIVTGILAVIPSGRDSSARSQKLYLVLAGVLGVILGWVGKVRVLENLGFSANALLNVVLTTLILMAGSDRIAALMRRLEGQPVSDSLAKERPEPIEIMGKLTLVDERTAAVEAATVRVAPEPPKPPVPVAGLGATPPAATA